MRTNAAVVDELDLNTVEILRALPGHRAGERLDATAWPPGRVETLQAQGHVRPLPVESPEREALKVRRRIELRRIEVEDRGRTVAAELASALDSLARVVGELEVAELAAARLGGLMRERKGLENKLDMLKGRTLELARETEELS